MLDRIRGSMDVTSKSVSDETDADPDDLVIDRLTEETKLRRLHDLRMHSPRRVRLVHLSIATSIQGQRL